ncbi:MAG: hypothetical protein JWM74_4019, partial [Myxococcaceae bacterium]|nr:hypothetical protein [Myxococcaceae bacterium]
EVDGLVAAARLELVVVVRRGAATGALARGAGGVVLAGLVVGALAAVVTDVEVAAGSTGGVGRAAPPSAACA